MYLKNADTITHTWHGQQISAGAYYEIEDYEKIGFANNSQLLTDIGAGVAVMARDDSGNTDIADTAEAINYLKNIDTSPRDSDGALLSRSKVTQTGWHYQLHGVEFESSNLDSEYSKDVSGTDFGFCELKFYDDEEAELTIQDDIDTDCVKTVLSWEPTHDIELIGGLFKQSEIPTTNIRMWCVGVPDVPTQYGGSKPFVANVNLKFLGTEEGIRIDGRATKLLPYDATNHTNKMQFTFTHGAGVKHKMHIIFELFKA